MATPPSPLPHSGASLPSPSLHSLIDFKAVAPAHDADPLAALRHQLASLPLSATTPVQRERLRELIYAQSIEAIDLLRASLTSTALIIPIAKTTRRQVRSAQQLLRMLCEDSLKHIDDATPSATGWREAAGRTLWRSVHALAQHLLIGSLVAAPAAVGIWRQMHQLFATARRFGVSDYSPGSPQTTIKNVYFSAILLACIQPASFTSTEIAFIAAYLALYADDVELLEPAETVVPGENSPPAGTATFWIDPTRDSSAFAYVRKAAPPQTPVDYFTCSRLAARLARQLGELEQGTSAALLGLPEIADTPAGQGVLRRLRMQWGEPSKRRFPRRRQNYRAQLCSGLRRLWRLLQAGSETPGDASHWMITNESPDGYALMHVSGKTTGLSVGDLTAIRSESGTAWQVCIVRWALSENQEHLELGLQILATHAQPARLGLKLADRGEALLPVLILPTIGALRPAEQLVIPASALGKLPDKLVLVVEKGNVELREVKCQRLVENNSKIAILAIEPDPLPH